MRVEFWEGKTKRGEADLPAPPQVGERVSLPAGTFSVTVPARWVLTSTPLYARVSVQAQAVSATATAV